jgi:hypothetical protein
VARGEIGDGEAVNGLVELGVEIVDPEFVEVAEDGGQRIARLRWWRLWGSLFMIDRRRVFCSLRSRQNKTFRAGYNMYEKTIN